MMYSWIDSTRVRSGTSGSRSASRGARTGADFDASKRRIPESRTISSGSGSGERSWCAAGGTDRQRPVTDRNCWIDRDYQGRPSVRSASAIRSSESRQCRRLAGLAGLERRPVGQRPGGLQLLDHVRELPADTLELPDGLAELLALLRVLEGVLDRTARDGVRQRRTAEPLPVQRPEYAFEPLGSPGEDVLLGHREVPDVEVGLGVLGRVGVVLLDPDALGSVSATNAPKPSSNFAQITAASACGTLLTQIFSPLATSSSSRSSTRVFIAPASDPASGSEIPMAITVSPAVTPGRYRSLSASEPCISMARGTIGCRL